MFFSPNSIKAVCINKEIYMTKLYQNGIFHKHPQHDSYFLTKEPKPT